MSIFQSTEDKLASTFASC